MPSRNVAEAPEPACAARASDRDSSSSSYPRVGVRRQGTGPGVPATQNGLVELARQARPEECQPVSLGCVFQADPSRLTRPPESTCFPEWCLCGFRRPLQPNRFHAVCRDTASACPIVAQLISRPRRMSTISCMAHRSARMRRCIRRGLHQLVGWRVVRQQGIGHLARCRSLFLVDDCLTELHAPATVPPPRQPGDSCGPCRLDRAGPGSLLLLSRRAC
jgi:hypothetical protein